MEVVKSIRVITSDKRCILKENSTFHVNLSGFQLPLEKKDLYVKVDNFYMPQKSKNIKFSIYFGADSSYLDSEQVKEFSLTYHNMADFCMQFNCLVWNEFLLKNINCKKTVEKTDVSGSCSTFSVADILEIRRKMGYSNNDIDCSGSFMLKYENCRFTLNIAVGKVFVATANLAKMLHFETELLKTLSKEETEAVTKKCELLSLCNTPVKICLQYVVGEVCHFLKDSEKMCHLLVKGLVNPCYRAAGGNYSVICSFNVEKMVMIPMLCILACRHVSSLEFCLLDDDMQSYFEGDKMQNVVVRFTLNVLKSL